MSDAQEDLRYPVGKFNRPASTLTAEERRELVNQIAVTPARMREADSHMNAYTRVKLALTEEQPTIKPYDEAAWAKLNDVRDTPIETSLVLLETLHQRWDTILRAMTDADFERTLIHPDHGVMTLDALIAMYAWHGRHHVGHITSLRSRSGW